MNKSIPIIALLLLFALFIGNDREVSPTIQETYHANKSKLVVVLSFDYEDLVDDQGRGNLPTIFEVLEKHNATATFFILGATAKRSPESVMKIYSRGYSLGLHTYYHNLPLFREEEASLIGGVYNYTKEEEWMKSFKTQDAFYRDLKMSQKVIVELLGDASEPKVFRSPSLVINWTMNPAYFEVLKKAGIEIDSSIYQDFSNPKPYYIENGVVEVPVVSSGASLNNLTALGNVADKCVTQGVPLVMYIHPQKLTQHDLGELDRFLDIVEDRYDVEYLRIEEVPEAYEGIRVNF